jgi:hypothetical protein
MVIRVSRAAPVGLWSFPWSLSESISRNLRAPQGRSHASHHLRAPRFAPSSPVSPITGECATSTAAAREPVKTCVVDVAEAGGPCRGPEQAALRRFRGLQAARS